MTSTVVVTIGAVTLALLILGAGAAALFVYLRQNLTPTKSAGSVMEELVFGHGVRLAELEIAVEGLPSLWEAEKKLAKRDADSARKARTAAAEKLEEIEEIVAANGELPGGNEALGDQLEMQPMLTRLGDPTPTDRRERVAAVAHLLR